MVNNIQTMKRVRRLFLESVNSLQEKLDSLDSPRVIEEPIRDYLRSAAISLNHGGPGHLLKDGSSKENLFERGLFSELQNEDVILERDHYDAIFYTSKWKELSDEPKWVYKAKRIVKDPSFMPQDFGTKEALILKIDIILNSMYRSRELVRYIVYANEGREEKPYGYDFLGTVRPEEFKIWSERAEKFFEDQAERWDL